MSELQRAEAAIPEKSSAPFSPVRESWRRFFKQRKTIPSLIILAIFLLAAVLAPVISPYRIGDIDLSAVLGAPGPHHWLGTDELGRDIFARMLFGTRVSMSVVVLAVGLALAIGLPIGLLSGYIGGKVDAVIMRIIDGMLAIPTLVFATALAATFGAGFHAVVIAIALMAVPSYARLVRGQVMMSLQQGYVEASRALGCRDRDILLRHILPNNLSPLIVQSTLHAAQAILVEAALSFLGVGIQLPTPSWGGMTHDGSGYMEIAPWLVFAPGAAMFLAVLAFNMVGDALRDAFDPRL